MVSTCPGLFGSERPNRLPLTELGRWVRPTDDALSTIPSDAMDAADFPCIISLECVLLGLCVPSPPSHMIRGTLSLWFSS